MSDDNQSKSSWASQTPARKLDVPKGLWRKCPKCEQMLFSRTVTENLEVCPECDYHFRIGARMRISQLADEGAFEEWLADYTASDPLEFVDSKPYSERIKDYREKTGLNEAMVMGKAFIRGREVVLGTLDFDFAGGTMGSVVGEKIAYAAEQAVELKIPLILVSCGGGARMQESVLSVLQMAKTSAAVGRLHDSGGLYISVLTDPTMGGITASYAMLGDIIIAEPGALIGFAGPRVIWQTIKVELPEGFQKAEFLLEHGFIDRVVHRKELRSELARLIDYLPVSPAER